MSKQPPIQSAHWVDQTVDQILEWQSKQHFPKLHVDDMKTPSGRVHTGSLRGVMIHDLVAQALAKAETDVPVVNTYIFNDTDSMDGLPSYLDPNIYSAHMGKPLFLIPAPELDQCGIDMSLATPEEIADFKRAKSFAEVYAFDFIHAFRKLGCTQEIVWSHEIYQAGQMDGAIRQALDRIDIMREIYRDVADYKLPEKWYPFQVICPQCGKVGTTLVTDWDGTEVTFDCLPHKVEWAEGCGYHGKVSPFGGTGKLLWKVDWPAHWKVLGINVEGAGKDHTSAGGSRDMASAICQRVFEIPEPFDIPYEWILIKGAKMSSSKGIGTSAREFTEVFPAHVGRFLFASRHFNQVIEFDPKAMAIPDLFDDYDAGARIFWGEEEGDLRLARSFELAQIGDTPQSHFLPRFRDLALWMQYPDIDVEAKCAEIKGSPLTDADRAEIAQRLLFARIWVDRYAPEDYQFGVTAELPVAAESLSADQKTFVHSVNELVESQTWAEPQELQQAIYELAKASLGAKLGFQAIYQAFLGKSAGPRAARLLLSIEPSLRAQRVSELTATGKTETAVHRFEALNRPDTFSIDPGFAEQYPSATVGIAVIRGIQIQAESAELEAAKAKLLSQLTGLTTDQINAFPEITSYRKMYREMGIDWHSRRPSPEALLRRIAQGKDLYRVNTCVDAYNLVVMKHRVSVGAFDLNTIQFPTKLQVAEGGEQILLLGDSEPTTLKAGEVSYFDHSGPYNLDFNYRDAQRTMVTNDTTDLLINVEGVYDITRAQVEQSLQETIEMIQKYCGGTVEFAGIVSAIK